MKNSYLFASVIFFCAATASLRAETTAGSAAQLIKETRLRKSPEATAESLGRLPKGTILSLQGEREGDFVSVEVELESGNTVEGWVEKGALNKKARGADPNEDEEKETKSDEPEEKKPRPRSRMQIPKDEALLLKRDPSFFYGVQAGGNYAMLLPDTSTETYTGMGFTGGAHIGIFVANNFPMRFEVNYTMASGTATTGSASFGLADFALIAQYEVERFELMGGAQYSFALSSSEVPSDIKFDEVADLSTPVFLGGIGYHFPLGEITQMAVRARYGASLYQDPIAFHFFTLQLAIGFNG